VQNEFLDMKKKVFVALSTFAQYGSEPLDMLTSENVEYTINNLGRRLVKEELIQMASGCHGIIAGVEPYDKDVLDALTELECISRCGVGIDNIDYETARAKGIVIRNTPDVVIQPVAELTIAMIFCLLRRLIFHTVSLRSGKWHKSAGGLLYGKKVGILGLGRIGKRVASILNSIGCEVIASDICPDVFWAKEHNVRIVSIEELLRESDILSIHLSYTGGNRFVLGRKQIALMKEGCVIINTSRGCFLDENAIYEALKEGKLGGAGLDVFLDEPYRGPLCELDNVVLTPHIATLTRESRLNMEIEATISLLESLGINIMHT